MRLIKRLFWFCVVVFVASVVGMFWYLTPERVRAFVEPRLEKGFGREVVVDQVDWGVGKGVVVDGLEVKGKDGKGAFVTAKRAQVDVSPGTLLWGEGRLGELVLEDVVVSVVVDKKGEVNAKDVLGKDGLTLPVDRVRVINGMIRVDNQRSGRLTVVSGVDGNVLGMRGESGVVLDSELEIGEVMTVAKGDSSGLENLRLDGRVKVLDGVWVAEDMKVGVGALAMTVSGSVRDPWRGFVVDVVGEQQQMDLADMTEGLVAMGVLGEGAVLRGGGTGEVVVKGQWPFEVKGKVAFEGVSMTDRSRLALPLVEGELGVFLEGDRVRVHVAKGRIGRSDVAMSGVIDNVWSKWPHASFAFVAQVLDLDELKPQEPAVAWGWAGEAFAAKWDGMLQEVVDGVDLDGSVRVVEAVWHGAVFENVETALRGRKGRLHVGPIFGQVHEGALKGNVVMDGGKVDASMSLVNAKADQVVKMLGWQVPVEGSVHVTAKMAGMMDAVGSATGTVRMAQGRLSKWDFLQRELHGVEQLGVLTADEVSLKDVRVVFKMVDDELHLDGTTFQAAEMDCVVGGKGTLGGDLHYVLDVDVPASRIKVAGFNVGQALGALLGRQATIPVRVKIEGTTSVPEVVAEVR